MTAETFLLVGFFFVMGDEKLRGEFHSQYTRTRIARGRPSSSAGGPTGTRNRSRPPRRDLVDAVSELTGRRVHELGADAAMRWEKKSAWQVSTTTLRLGVVDRLDPRVAHGVLRHRALE